jgi:hypothetical protein
MNTQSVPFHASLQQKASELGISGEIFSCALDLLSRNRNLVNAIDHRVEMDDYIYQAIIRQSIEKRRAIAENDLSTEDEELQEKASKDLAVLSREELTTDPFFRAVLPLLMKVVNGGPILRLYAEEASTIVIELADFKRRHRATSFTEVIVKRCGPEIEGLYATEE